MSCDSRKRNSAAARAPKEMLTGLGAAALILLALIALNPEIGGAFRLPVTICAFLVALIVLIAFLRKISLLQERAERRQALSHALGADRQARLIADAEGEILRNAQARTLFGPAADPLAPLLARIDGDDRAIEEIERLRAVAAHGGAHHAEISFLAGDEGAREWLALAVHPLEGSAFLLTAEDVSARRAIDETLRREHEMLADFIDFLPVGFYCADTEGKFRFVNQRLAEWVGRSSDELVGLGLEEVLGVVPNPEDDRAEMRFKGRNGDVFRAFVTHTQFDEGGETLTRSVVVRDLIPERHWERSLRMAERRFQWLFEDAPVGIVLADPDGSINRCNQAFAAMIGDRAEALSGRAIEDFILSPDRAGASELFSRALMGTSIGGHLPVRLVNGLGGDITATLFVGSAKEEDAISGLVLHFIDTTEQRNLEIQFAQSQKMQAMGQLAGGVAHDFNNLLTAMIGFCDLLLLRHGPGDSSFSDVMQIKQNANRAASLIRQLLAFSRRQRLQPKLIDVTDALSDLSNLLRRLLGERINLVFTHGRDLGPIRVDPGQFDQVIINLAVNARDAMQGGGTLSITTRTARIERHFQRGTEIMPPGDYVTIEVADTGTGITPENLARIFEPFFSTKEVGAGTGLGLSTVYGILRQTGGFIFVDSQPGHGSSFRIYLPRIEPSPDELTGKTGSEGAPESHDLTGNATILLVEDEDAVRLFGSKALRSKGYRVIEARSGEGALDALHAEPHIDVLVTDVVMPGMDGATLARLVRMERPNIQAILMSGYTENIALGDTSGEKGIHFLAKPFSLKQLAGKVHDVLANPV